MLELSEQRLDLLVDCLSSSQLLLRGHQCQAKNTTGLINKRHVSITGVLLSTQRSGLRMRLLIGSVSA